MCLATRRLRLLFGLHGESASKDMPCYAGSIVLLVAFCHCLQVARHLYAMLDETSAGLQAASHLNVLLAAIVAG
jgi:hypothetical protein